MVRTPSQQNKPFAIHEQTQCGSYPPHLNPPPVRTVRCPNKAAGVLQAPTGEMIMIVCSECAHAITTEYREKLGDIWLFHTGPPAVHWFK